MINNSLIQLTTQDVSRAIPVTTSLIVADYFEKEHSRVLRDIRETIQELKDIGETEDIFYYYELKQYKDSYGRETPVYEMNKTFFMILVMGYTGKKAFKLKNNFIKNFTLMENELLAREKTRHIGIKVRRSMTEAISQYVKPEGSFKKFAYGNYTKLVYKKILGMDVKTAKEKRGLKEGDNLRDFLEIEELEQVQKLEEKIAYFIEFSDTAGMNDKQVYELVKNNLHTFHKV